MTLPRRRFLDANMVVRHLTGDPADQAARVTALIASGGPLWITETALAEAGFVTERRYGVARQQVVDGLVAFVREPNVEMYGLDDSLVIRALLYCRPSRRVSYADALIWAEVYSAGGDLYTFDQRFLKEGISLLQP